MEWNNENGNSGSINASLYPELLQCNGENWLKKVQVSLLSGWWLCVGQDSDRCVGSYVFFTNDGINQFEDSNSPKRGNSLNQIHLILFLLQKPSIILEVANLIVP